MCNNIEKSLNARGTLFAAAMLDLALVSLFVLNLAVCHSSPILFSHVQNVSDDVPRHRGDVINAAACSDICSTDQTALSKCQEVTSGGKGLPILPLDVFFARPSLACRSNSSLTVGWVLRDQEGAASHTYLTELLAEYDPDTPCNQVVVDSAFVTQNSYVNFADLNETSKYYVRLTVFNCTAQLGDSLLTDELWTLSATNFTLEPPINITLEDLVYVENKGFEGNLKWWPAEVRSCFYHLIVFSQEGFFYECELEVPKDPFTKKIPELKYSQNYTFKMFTRTVVVDKVKESRGSYFSYLTASCLDTHKNLTVCAPDAPSNVSLRDEWKSTADFNEGQLPFYIFDITVSWAEPQYKPEYYLVNISSLDNNNFSDFKMVSGIKTAVTFKSANVGLAYIVTIAAVSPGGQSYPILFHREIPKPLPVAGNYTTGTLIWAILGPIGSFVSIIGVAVFAYHRHEKLKLYKKRCRYFEELEQKAPKEVDNGSSFTIPPEDDAFEVVPEKIILYEVLGEGAFGVVRKGWLPDHNREVAVKMLKDEPSAEEVKQFRQEIDMMKSVGSHAHIVSLVGCCTRPHSTMMLVVEFCARGDLQNYLRWAWDVMTSRSNGKPLLSTDLNMSEAENSNGQIKYSELLTSENSDCNGSLIHSQPNLRVNRLYDLQQSIKDTDEDRSNDITAVDLLSFSRQIAMGMEFLSSNRVVHRDLAARNVLVCSDKTVKIADFGLSRDIYQENMYKKTGSGKLPIKWMALESLTHQVYTTQSDVWSFGVLLWEIVTLGGNPYPTVPTGRLHKLLQSGYRLECPVNCSQDLYNLMLSCWQTRPKDRPGFSDIRLQLDKLLDGMCSQAYLSLDVIEYKENNQARIIASNQLSKGSENNQNELKTMDSERYVRPITIGRKPAILPVQPNHYISQPSSGNYPHSPGTIISDRSFSTSIRHPSVNKLNKQATNIGDCSFILMDQDKLYADDRIPNGHLQNAINTISRNNSLGCKTPQHLKACAVTQFAGH